MVINKKYWITDLLPPHCVSHYKQYAVECKPTDTEYVCKYGNVLMNNLGFWIFQIFQWRAGGRHWISTKILTTWSYLKTQKRPEWMLKRLTSYMFVMSTLNLVLAPVNLDFIQSEFPWTILTHLLLRCWNWMWCEFVVWESMCLAWAHSYNVHAMNQAIYWLARPVKDMLRM